MTSNQLHAAADSVIEELEVQMNLLDQDGCMYVRSYLTAFVNRTRMPRRPAGMHPQIAKAIRDMVMDEAIAIRLYGPRGQSAHGTASDTTGSSA